MAKKTILELIIDKLQKDKFQLSFDEILELMSDDYPEPSVVQMSCIYRAFKNGLDRQHIIKINTVGEKRKFMGHYYKIGPISYVKKTNKKFESNKI